MCRRNGCKKYGDRGVALDAIEVDLCDEHRFEFSTNADAEALHSEHVRLKAEEARELAALYGCGVDVSFDAHSSALEDSIAHRLKRKAFVLEWLARPIAETTEPAK